ncbi:hypothetical protein CCP3SC1_70039 [Gammaproteobacteria bacterium]
MATHNPDIELSAIQFVIWAILSSHPDKPALLSRFDTLRETGRMSPALREELDKYRAMVEKKI